MGRLRVRVRVRVRVREFNERLGFSFMNEFP